MTYEFIEINDVSVNYEINNLLAVSGLDMKIKSGSFSAVVGPSGCGKSTLMKILSGLIKPTTGNVKINNSEVTGPQNFVGMAFQNPVMMPWRKTLDNVLIPFEILVVDDGSTDNTYRYLRKKSKTCKTLKILKHSDDGFYIAEEDLKLRGYGDIIGYQQSGEKNFMIADPIYHSHLFELAKDNLNLHKENDQNKYQILLKIFKKDKIFC